MIVDIQNYKNAMSQMATGVTIVTSYNSAQHFGMTVSSFTSVSLDPPMVSICIDKRVAILNIIQGAKTFAVNILSDEQVELGKRFSNPHINMNERFEMGNWKTSSLGNEILNDALGFMDCKLHQTFDIGDHVIFIGEVQNAGAQDKASPAIYYHREWRRLKII